MNETVVGFLYFKYNKKGAESLRFSSLRRGRDSNADDLWCRHRDKLCFVSTLIYIDVFLDESF